MGTFTSLLSPAGTFLEWPCPQLCPCGGSGHREPVLVPSRIFRDRAGSRTSLHDRKICVIPCKFIFN